MMSSAYPCLVLEVLRTTEKGLIFNEIINRIGHINSSKSEDLQKIRRAINHLIGKGRINSTPSIRGNVHQLGLRPTFPGSPAWFSAYLAYTKNSNKTVLELLKSAYRAPKSGQNEGIEPELEEVKQVLREEIDVCYYSDSLESDMANEELYVWFQEMNMSRIQEDLAAEVSFIKQKEVEDELLREVLRESQPVQDPESVVPETETSAQKTQISVMEEGTSFTSSVTYDVKLCLQAPGSGSSKILISGKEVLIVESETHPETHVEIQIPYCLPGDQPSFISYVVPAPPRTDQQGPSKISVNLEVTTLVDGNSSSKKKLLKTKPQVLNCLRSVEN